MLVNDRPLKHMSGDDGWHYTGKQPEKPWGVTVFAEQKVRFCGDRDAVLENFLSPKIGFELHCDTYQVIKDSQEMIFPMPDSFSARIFDGRVASVYMTFQKQVMQLKRKTFTLCASLINQGIENVEEI